MFKKMKIMKRNLFLVLPLLVLVVLSEACSTKSDPVPVPAAPTGSYSGKFKLLVKKTTGSGYDTVKNDPLFAVTLSQPSKYVVTSSTPSIHALSRGLFQYDPYGQIIRFIDSTYVPGPQTSYHLAGDYQYRMNTTQLQFIRPNNSTTQDTIFFYDLKKTSN
jgi:hypothetical protein